MNATTRATLPPLLRAELRLNSWRTDSGGPTSLGTISTRPVRSSRTASSPSIRASSSSFSAAWTAGTEAAWPNRWATSIRQCQSFFEYGCALQVTSSTAAST